VLHHIASLERRVRGSVVAMEMDDQGDKVAGGKAGWRIGGPCRYSPLVSQLDAAALGPFKK